MRPSILSKLSWHRFDPAAPAVWGLAVLAALAAGLSCTMPELTRVEGTTFPRAAACAHCHVEIHREWSHSNHAAAWTNPAYRIATDDHRYEECLGCHAPTPRYATTQPAVRPAGRETGVTCVCCHLEQAALAGPIVPGGLVAPHPVSVRPERYRDARLCGRCHKGTLTQWQQARQSDTPTCQACHMPGTRRKMTQATNAISKLIVAFERADDQRRHTFDPAPYADPDLAARVPVKVTWQGRLATVTLRNGLPHNLPTGDFSFRVVSVEVSEVDGAGQATPKAHWELTRSGGGAVPPGGARSWQVTASPAARALRVVVSRRGPDHAVLFERPAVEVPVP